MGPGMQLVPHVFRSLPTSAESPRVGPGMQLVPKKRSDLSQLPQESAGMGPGLVWCLLARLLFPVSP